MATKIIKAWVDGAIQEIEVEDVMSPEQELSIEDRLVELEDKPIITDGNLLVGNGTEELEEMTPEEVLSHINGASVMTMTTEEYEALGDDESNANTLYLLTDTEEKNVGMATAEGGEIFNDYENNQAGEYAHAEGCGAKASGFAAHAEGMGTALGDQSHAEGDGTAYGYDAHAEGESYAYGYASHAEGGGVAWGECSHVEGYSSEWYDLEEVEDIPAYWMENRDFLLAYGTASHAEGNSVFAEGDYSHAEGEYTKAGYAAHAEGSSCWAEGNYSHAEGEECFASGYASHAEGCCTGAEGTSSHAEGESTRAKGSGSHAEGYCTIADGQYQHVQGKYNIEDTENKYAHIVGNGESNTTRSNAHTLDWDGNAWFAGNVSASGGTMTGALNTSGIILTEGEDYGDVAPTTSTKGKLFFIRLQ